MDRFVTRVGMRERGPIERLLETDGEPLDRGLIGARHSLRWHHSAAEFQNDFLPDISMGGRVGRIEIIEREAAGLEPRVVAGDAILLDEGGISSGCGARWGRC